jgi:hypothetical protein
MRSTDLSKRQQDLYLNDRAAAIALGMKATEYAAPHAGTVPIDHWIALACAAVAGGLKLWGSHDGLDESQPLKPRPKPQHLLPVHD